MRFIVMHKTNPRWEAGEKPSKELIAKVGQMMSGLIAEKRLLAGDGLRASSEGVRLRFHGGACSVTKGPLQGDNELPAGFTIVQVPGLDDAVAFAKKQADAFGDVEMDVRPVTEGWDIGMGEKPANLKTTRYMVLRKADAAAERGTPLTTSQKATLKKLQSDPVHMSSVNLKPSARGRRYKNTVAGTTMTDGPFTESKELIAGFVIITADSLDDAGRFVEPYMAVVETPEVDVRELADDL